MTTFSTSLSWPVAAEGLSAGETLTLSVRASDLNNVTGPSTAQSPELTLRLVTREELLAELARREQEYRMDFERLTDTQEQIRGGLLTAVSRLGQREDPAVLAIQLAALERRQRNVAGSVNVIRQRFEQILAELRVNQLDTRDERQRLGQGIIAPITQLAKRDLITAADMIRQWARETSPKRGSQVDPHQVAILSQMRAILANMLQWEGYQEVVSMLRDIIRLQRELHGETKEAIEDQAGDVFDD